MRQRAAPAMPAVVIDKSVAERGLGLLLAIRRVAGMHPHAAFIDRLLAEPADQLAPDLLGERAVLAWLRLAQPDIGRLRRRGLVPVPRRPGPPDPAGHPPGRPRGPRPRG